jgi:hypothetical protein
MFFALSSWVLAALLLVAVVGATVLGLAAGRRLGRAREGLREPFGVLQAATLGIVGLLLAFGLSLAIGRYEARRVAAVDEANAIGTTWLRAQMLAEPARAESLDILRRYTDLAIDVADQVPGSAAMDRTTAAQGVLQRRLWALAGTEVARAPLATAPRLYVETLNDMIDQQSVRLAALNNRVPNTVLLLEVVASAIALGLLALYLSFLGRGPVTVILAALLVTMLLFVTFDLDRPRRGLVTVTDTPFTSLRASMELPPAAE